MATAGQIITSAMRKCNGILASGEAPTESEFSDALETLNNMLDAWSIERLAVIATTEQIVTWGAGEATYTLGPTGEIVAERPVSLLPVTYFTLADTTTSYPLIHLNRDQYSDIPTKADTSNLPGFIYLNMSMPDISIYLYPVPSQELQLHMISTTPLSQVSDIYAELSLAPGYKRAIIYNLTCELCGEFGLTPSATVQRIAMASKRAIKRINNPKVLLEMPLGVVRR